MLTFIYVKLKNKTIMSLNVIDLIKGQLGPALVSQAASQLGESEAGISKAISAFLPAVVGAFANNADSPGIHDAIKSVATSGMLSNLLQNSSTNPLMSSVLFAIFGDKVNALVNAVSSFAGVSNSSSNSILKMVVGAALGSISKYAADQNLDATGTKNLLKDQKGIASTLLPVGLSMASLGLGNLFSEEKILNTNDVSVSEVDDSKIEVTRGGNTHVNANTNEDNVEGGSIWKWLLPLLLLALAAWFLWKQMDKPAADNATITDSTTVIQDSSMVNAPGDSTSMNAAKIDTDIDLNGTMLKGYKGGMEDLMVAFLKSGGYKDAANDAALKDTWYTFDKVNFKMASSSDLEAGSPEQMDNLLAILKAYPEAKIKIGGYTDNVGDEKVNLKLSQDRADYIKKWLTDKGAGAQVIAAEGYGSKFATVAATATDAERAIDRRMVVRFAK